MRFGVAGTAGTVRELVDLAVDAQAHGWDGWFTWDGLDAEGVDTSDPWTVLTAVATPTERVTWA